jgi:cytidine deaminase
MKNKKQHEHLVLQAMKARELAFAPFSKFQVGAAVQTTNGSIYRGANVENSSYGLTICAERAAIFNAVSNGHRPGDIVSIAVVANMPGQCSPCGACRQVIFEFGEDITVIMSNLKKKIAVSSIRKLLPFGFRLDKIRRNFPPFRGARRPTS